jgi:archaellum biogenesis ATPase FlaH
LLANPSSFPLVLPHKLVKLSVVEFIRKMRRYSYRLEQHYLSEHIDTIADEHNQLLHAYRTEQVLK